MGIMDTPLSTTRTQIHLRLTKALEDMGFDVEEETSFPPYYVDCYIREIHVALEADGPTHTEKKDYKRDIILLAQYALPVIRVNYEILQGKEKPMFKLIARAALRGPWVSSADDRALIARTGGADV